MLKTVNILTPYYSSTIWGGHFLAAQKCWGLDNPGVLLGESWEVSRLENHSAKTLDGRELTDITNGSQIPYLVKFIDTAKHLSIQVHPGDQYAMAHENSSGKSEMWTVLNAKDGAGIYLGFKDGVTKDQFFRTASSEGEVDSLLNFYPVVAGDSFFVPAGAVHAIGAGITLLEVQQSSGITYRVWDWNRLGVDGRPRKLHLDKAMDVLNFDPGANSKDYFNYRSDVLNAAQLVATHSQFEVSTLVLIAEEKIKLPPSLAGRHSSIVLLDGAVKLESSDQSFVLNPYQSALLAREQKEEVTILSEAASSRLMIIR